MGTFTRRSVLNGRASDFLFLYNLHCRPNSFVTPKIFASLLPLPVMAGKGKAALRQRAGHSAEPSNLEYESTQDDEHVDVFYQNPVRIS